MELKLLNEKPSSPVYLALELCDDDKVHGRICLHICDADGEPLDTGHILYVMPDGTIRLCPGFKHPGFKTEGGKVKVLD